MLLSSYMFDVEDHKVSELRCLAEKYSSYDFDFNGDAVLHSVYVKNVNKQITECRFISLAGIIDIIEEEIGE